MRISTGKYKGKVLKFPKGIRPTQDKVRKALFDILGDIKGISFLELFAGSGAVGFEAASRGAARLTLIEQDRECCLAIKKNIAYLNLKDYELYQHDAQKAIEKLHQAKNTYDIIFLDPPYYQDMAKKTLQMLGSYDILAPDGFIIAQHFKKDTLPENAGELVLFRQSCYGDTVLSFYKKCAR